MTDPVETEVGWLRQKLSGMESDITATPAQLEAIDRACDHYAASGLIVQGWALPLYEACPACAECWRDPELPRPEPENATVSVP